MIKGSAFRIFLWTIFCLVVSFVLASAAMLTQANGIKLVVLFAWATMAGYVYGSLQSMKVIRRETMNKIMNDEK